MIKLNVSAANIAVEEKETLTEGRVGLLCQFRFTDEWAGLAKTAVFDGADSRDVILKNDTVAIPAECLAAEGYSLSVGVYGKNSAGDIVIPTVYATVGKIQRSAYPSGKETAPPTPDVVAQIQQAAANAEALARSVREDADLGKLGGPAGPKGEKGDKGETGADGKDGADGKSAYTYAVEGGYTGTEAAFTEKLALEIDAPYISGKIEAKVPFMKYGRKLESGTDLNSLVPASADDGVSGTYYSPNSTTTNSLLNCPFSGLGFILNVSYSTGNDYKYIRQEIKSYAAGDWVRSYSNGTWSAWRKTVKTGSEEWNSLVRVDTVKRHPSLTAAQKAAIKALIKDYVDNRSAFYYYGDETRNAFATGEAYDSEKGKWGLNCGTFVQNILMGRSVSDYVGKTADTYTNTITKTDVSDFGYYFEFKNRETAYGLIRDSEATDPAEYYFGYIKPLSDSYKYSYSRNSYWLQESEDAGNIGGQTFNTFMFANDMAYELYQKGCEISLAELEIGDILFSKTPGDSTTESATFFHKMAWRNISHAFMVYNIADDGAITLVECTGGSPSILLRPQNGSYNDDRTRFAYLMRNTVFCARLPAAWGGAGNVPDKITAI